MRLDAVGVRAAAVLVIEVEAAEVCDRWCIGTRGGRAVDGWTLHDAVLMSPDGSVNIVPAPVATTTRLTVDLGSVPPEIERLSVAIAAPRPGTPVPGGLFALSCGGVRIGEYRFSAAGGETALLVADLYRKDGWRVAAVGQGYVGGPEALFRSFGVAVPRAAPAPPPPVAAPSPPPALSASPPLAVSSSPAATPPSSPAEAPATEDPAAVDPAVGFRPEWFGPVDAPTEVADRPFLAIVSFGDTSRLGDQPGFDPAGEPVLLDGERVLWSGPAKRVEVARKARGGSYRPETATEKMSPQVTVTDRRILVSYPDWRKGGGLALRMITATDQDARASTLTGHLPLQAILQLNSTAGTCDVVQVFWVFHSGAVEYSGVVYGRVSIEVDANGGALAQRVRNAIVQRWRGEAALPPAARDALDQTVIEAGKADVFGRIMNANTERFVVYRAMGSGRFFSRVDGVPGSALPDDPAMFG